MIQWLYRNAMRPARVATRSPADFIFSPNEIVWPVREHNLHEYRLGSMQRKDPIFATYHNAGWRIYDIRNAFQPKETGYFVPPPPEKLVISGPICSRLFSPAKFLWIRKD